MAKLVAVSPCARLLPVTAGGVTISEIVLDQIYSFAPFAGQTAAVSALIERQLGMPLSPVGFAATRRRVRMQWLSQGCWIVTRKVALDGVAAMTDQSDAWAVVHIAGAPVVDVLSRLVPIDLREAVFVPGQTARTLLGHMSVAITRVGADEFEIMGMRSMAGTLVHELTTAARQFAMRDASELSSAEEN